VKRVLERGLKGALFRYQVMANIVGVLIIPLFFFTGLHIAFGGYKAELAIFGVTHGYLYIVYLVAAGYLALKARLHIPWIILMFGAGLVPGLTFVVEWLVVTRKIHPLLAEQAAATSAGTEGDSRGERGTRPGSAVGPGSGQSRGGGETGDASGVSPAAR
jgi:integral membrane protein